MQDNTVLSEGGAGNSRPNACRGIFVRGVHADEDALLARVLITSRMRIASHAEPASGAR